MNDGCTRYDNVKTMKMKYYYERLDIYVCVKVISFSFFLLFIRGIRTLLQELEK